MYDPDDRDRDAIIARRAILLSTALAALHCSSPDPSTPPSSSAGNGASTAPGTSQSVHRPASAPLEPWAEVMKKGPPRGVPKTLRPDEQSTFESLEKNLTARYAAIEAVWNANPDCDAADSGCKPQWRELAKTTKAMFDATRGPLVPGCGPQPWLTASVQGRRDAHERYVAELKKQAEAHLTSVSASLSWQSEQEWLKLLAGAKKPPPMPCLSPCAMPDVSAMSQSIPFDKDSSSLRSDASVTTSIDGVLATFKANRKPSRIIVRGHADSREARASEVAMARAKAVAAKLTAAGILKENIEIVSLDASVPIGNGADEERSAINRRVDFEAVPL